MKVSLFTKEQLKLLEELGYDQGKIATLTKDEALQDDGLVDVLFLQSADYDGEQITKRCLMCEDIMDNIIDNA